MQQMINRFTRNPNHLFLLDGTGACLTALVLILNAFMEWFGMPATPLRGLIIYASLLCIFSLGCALLLKKNWRPLLRVVIIANAVYGVATAFLISEYYTELSCWGLVYFCAEIVVLIALIVLEVSVLRRSRVAT